MKCKNPKIKNNTIYARIVASIGVIFLKIFTITNLTNDDKSLGSISVSKNVKTINTIKIYANKKTPIISQPINEAKLNKPITFTEIIKNDINPMNIGLKKNKNIVEIINFSVFNDKFICLVLKITAIININIIAIINCIGNDSICILIENDSNKPTIKYTITGIKNNL